MMQKFIHRYTYKIEEEKNLLMISDLNQTKYFLKNLNKEKKKIDKRI